MIQVGIVGLGFMGVTHIRAYRKIEGVRIAAICDAVRLPLDGDLSQVSGNLGDADPVKLDMSQTKAYKDINELLANPDVDLIDLCVPTPAHPKLSIASLKAGKHVICEKPLARNSVLAREIADAAQAAKGFFMPAMCLRFWPEWAWVKKAIEHATYGRVLSARFRRVSEPPLWGRESYFKGEQSGGALLDLHIHDTDFVQFCFGRPRAVFSSGFTHYSGAIDHVVTQYKVESGATVSAEGTWVMTEGFGFNMEYTVVFEKATADYNLKRGADALQLFEHGQPVRTVHCEGGDGYVGELSHMIDSITSGKPPTIVTARDGQSAVDICEAEERSIQTGQVVTLG
jgi:predicted dehydrogenase